MSSVDEDFKTAIRKDYEFWLGNYQTDGEKWKSGVVHAYHNVINEIERKRTDCPCHICTAMRDKKR